MHLKLIHIIFLTIIVTSCDNEAEMQVGPNQEVRYVIFSSFDPDCSSADCVTTYKIDNLKFFKDIQNTIINQKFPYQGRYVFFSASEKMVKDFLQNIPSKLLNHKDSVIGDCNECQKVYLEIGFEDKTRYWLIANENADHPAYLQNLINQVQQTIIQLQTY